MIESGWTDSSMRHTSVRPKKIECVSYQKREFTSVCACAHVCVRADVGNEHRVTEPQNI